MLRVPYFKQDRAYSCGPAVLQMVFAFYGVRISERRLAARLGTDSHAGTRHDALIEQATGEGFYVYCNNDSSLDEIAFFLHDGVPVIVHFVEPSSNEGHYAVAIGVTPRAIKLNDPWNGAGFKMPADAFTARWHSGDGEHRQWIMAVSPRRFALGRQYMPH